MGYSYSNTNGTGDRTGGGGITVTTTATLGAGTIAKLVDGSLTANSTHATWFNNGQSGVEIKFDFGTGRVVRQARWYQDTGAPGVSTHGTWKWRGSNDDSTYTDIGSAFTLGGVGGAQIHTELINNTTSYRYYKLAQQTGTTNSGPWLEEIEFFIDGATDEEGDTSYAYPLGGSSGAGAVAISGGSGVDRSSHITITVNHAAGGGEPTSNLVDGATANNGTDSWEFPVAGQTDQTFKFQFDVAQRITALTWEQNTSTAQGTYTLSGSNDDSSYTTIQTGIVLVNGSSFNETTFTNVNSYIYYKLTQTAGTTSNSPWVHEIYFKLVPTTITTGVTGTWASTEATDTFAGAGGLLGGSWVSTEARDTFAAAGYPKLTGTMAPTEPADTFAGSGGLLGGSWASIEARDLFSAAGYPQLKGSWASTEPTDIFEATAPVQVIGTLAATDTPDTFAASGIPNPVGTLAVTEARDTFAAAGYPRLRGTMAVTDTKDTFAGTGAPLLTGQLSAVETRDQLAGTGVLPSIGTLAVTEAPDTITVAGGPPASLGIDAHATGSNHNAASASVNISTLYVNDVIVLAIATGGFFNRAPVASITDTAGLTWKKRNQRWQQGFSPSIELWWAKKPAAGPTTITVNTTGTTGYICLDALAIKGANANAPWDTHTGAGWLTDNTFGNPTGHLYSNCTKGMALAFYNSTDVPSTGTVTAGWTWLERAEASETNGYHGRLESAYKVFDGAKLFTDPITFGQVAGGTNNRAIWQDVIVSKDEPDIAHVATDDVIRWFFDGHGNETILSMSGTNNSATQTFQTLNTNTVAVVAVMIQSALGARVDHITDDGGHTWVRRSIVANDTGTISLEVWWTQMASAFTGNVTVFADSNIQTDDVIGFAVVGINGPSLALRGEIWDGDASLPNTNSSSLSAGYQHTGPFSSLNDHVLELNVVANTGSGTSHGNPTGFNEAPWLQFIGDYFGSVGGELVSSAPPFNIAFDFKFSAAPVDNETVEANVSPQPDRWFMIADAMPVGPPSPPIGSWHSTEAKDKTTHTGDYTSIGIASPLGWVGAVPVSAAMDATEPTDFNTNSGAFTAIWDINGWIAFVPAFADMAATEAADTMALKAWVIGPTTILARWESTEAKDRFAFSGPTYSSYLTPDSYGDRTSRITVTTNATLGSTGTPSGTPDRLVDGVRANGTASAIWVTNVQSQAMYFRFQFGSPRRLTEATWYQNGPSAQPGLWKWQGSNDGTTWTDLSATFTLNGSGAGSVIGDLSGNITDYSYYQILQTTNAGGNDSPWLWEIEFKVGGIGAAMAIIEARDRAAYQGQVIPLAQPLPARKRRLLIVT